MKRFILAGLFAVGMFMGSAQAASFTDNTYGVPERSTQEIDYEVVTSKLFDAFSISNSFGTITGNGTSTFHFEEGGTSTTAGKTIIAGYDELLLYYNMGSWSASNTGTVTLRLYIQSGTEDTWFDLNADTVITGTTTGTINISETAAKAFRAGLNTTAIGTESVTVTLDKRRKKR